MIQPLQPSNFTRAAALINTSFATVATDVGFTEQTFPTFTGFTTNADRLRTHAKCGWLMYGLFENEQLIGYASLSQVSNTESTYELHNLAVLPEYRHKGYGKQLLDFCKAKVIERGGVKIKIGIIEENTVLKNWYTANGFVHTGTQKYDHMPITVGTMEWEG